MLMYTREKNGKYIEVHYGGEDNGVTQYIIEIFDCTPNGRFCEKSLRLDRDVFNLLTD